MNTTTKPTAATTELADMVRPFLPEGEITPEALAKAVADAQASWDRFFQAAAVDGKTNGYLLDHLAGTYDEHRARAA